MELIDQLVGQFKVNKHQAQGGVGALLYVVREHVAPVTFDEVRKILPDADAWMKSSPEGGEGIIGMLDGIFGSVAGGKLDAFARIGGHFQSLGISPKMVRPFTELVLSYLRDSLDIGPRSQIEKLRVALVA